MTEMAGPTEWGESVGVGPWAGPWPDDPRYDPALLADGDRRNVVDRYRYWTLEAIVADLDRLTEAVGSTPAGATVVVFHTAVLPYVPSAERAAFTELVRGLPVRWIAQEGPGLLPDVDAQLPDEAHGRFVLSADGRPLAWAAPHGGRVDWFGGTMRR